MPGIGRMTYPVAVFGDLAAQQQRMVAATCADLARGGIGPQATWVREGHLAQLQAGIAWTGASGRQLRTQPQSYPASGFPLLAARLSRAGRLRCPPSGSAG